MLASQHLEEREKKSGQKIHYDSISKNNTYITSNYEQRQQRLSAHNMHTSVV
jgi:hypothetical protein